MNYDHRKQSLYFHRDLIAELREEAARLDRSLSWLIQYAWKHGGRDAVKKIPSLEAT